MVQRYDYDTKIVDGWKEHRGVFENDSGGYVKYEDYLALQAQVRAEAEFPTIPRWVFDQIPKNKRYELNYTDGIWCLDGKVLKQQGGAE